MAEDNNRVVVVQHHVITEEVRALPPPPTETNKEEDEWCCTRIQEARKRNADNAQQCCSDVIQILLESCGVLILFSFENIFGIVFLILGVVFLNDCPIEPSIPISLIVFGVFSMIHGITVQLIRWKYVDINKKRDGFATCAQVIVLVATIIHFIALFWACYTVFGIRRRVKTGTEDKGTENYCHPILYWFAFWFFIFMAILGLIMIMLLCCLCCFVLSGGLPEPQQHIVVVHQPGNQSAPNGQPNANKESTPSQQPNPVNQVPAVTQPTTGA